MQVYASGQILHHFIFTNLIELLLIHEVTENFGSTREVTVHALMVSSSSPVLLHI